MASTRQTLALTTALACWLSAVPSSAITNPSFEDDAATFTFNAQFPSGWGGAAGGGGHRGQVVDVGSTDGSYAAQLYVAVSGAAPGASAFPVRLEQSVDLTGIDVITFDAELHPEIGWNPAVVAEFRIGASVEWTKTSGGVFLGQTVDVSGFSGVHVIEFRLTAHDSGPATGGHNFLVDHLRDTPPSPRLTGARVEPHVIRAGVDVFTMTVTVSDPAVEEVHIDLGSGVTQGGSPAGVVVFRDDGTQGDAVASDGIYSATGIGVNGVPALLGIEVLRLRDVDYVYASAPAVAAVEDLALGLRSMNPAVPIPTVTDHAADVRASSHAVSVSANLVGVFPEQNVLRKEVAQRQYEFLPDDVDFLLFSHDYPNNVASGTFSLIRNDVSGTGQPIVDGAAEYGSAGVLRGLASVYFGNAADFELWNHELLHYWAVHLDPGLELGTGHWDAITGASSGFGSAYAFDRFELISGNSYRGVDYPDADFGAFHDLELYLMGLLPDTAVAPLETLIDPVFTGLGPPLCDPECATTYEFTAGGTASVSMADILTEQGVRSPAHPDSPQHFKGRLVVVFDRVLSDTELAYYDTAMREYEKTSSSQGLTFAAATGDLGTISLPEPGALASLLGGVLALSLLRRARPR